MWKRRKKKLNNTVENKPVTRIICHYAFHYNCSDNNCEYNNPALISSGVVTFANYIKGFDYCKDFVER